MRSRATRARIGRCVLLGLMLGSLLVISPTAQATTTFQVVATIDVGVNPFGVAMKPDGSSLWVVNSGNFSTVGHTVTRINPSTYAIQGTINVGNFPEDVAFTPSGSQAFVTNTTDATVSVINATTNTVTQTVDLSGIPMRFPTGVAVTPDASKVFVTSIAGQEDTSRKNIAVLNNSNPANVTIGSTITLTGNTGRPAFTPDGSQFVAGYNVGNEAPPGAVFINPSNNAILATPMLTEVGVNPGTAVTPDGRFTYLTKFSIDGGTGKVWVIDNATHATVTTIPMPDRSMYGIRITPDGRFAFATNFALNQVTVISTATNQIVANIPVGTNPNDIAFTPDSTKAFVTNEGNTTVSVISISG
jgi:YVTN family beta-propeller protein